MNSLPGLLGYAFSPIRAVGHMTGLSNVFGAAVEDTFHNSAKKAEQQKGGFFASISRFFSDLGQAVASIFKSKAKTGEEAGSGSWFNWLLGGSAAVGAATVWRKELGNFLGHLGIPVSDLLKGASHAPPPPAAGSGLSGLLFNKQTGAAAVIAGLLGALYHYGPAMIKSGTRTAVDEASSHLSGLLKDAEGSIRELSGAVQNARDAVSSPELKDRTQEIKGAAQDVRESVTTAQNTINSPEFQTGVSNFKDATKAAEEAAKAVQDTIKSEELRDRLADIKAATQELQALQNAVSALDGTTGGFFGKGISLSLPSATSERSFGTALSQWQKLHTDLNTQLTEITATLSQFDPAAEGSENTRKAIIQKVDALSNNLLNQTLEFQQTAQHLSRYRDHIKAKGEVKDKDYLNTLDAHVAQTQKEKAALQARLKDEMDWIKEKTDNIRL